MAFFALGFFIFWLIYKDQDINRIKSVLKNEVNYFWIFVSLFIGLLSHISRTLRWGLMIEPVSHKPRIFNTFLAVMVGYLMNLALPRMGEISRCGVLSRYEKIPFTKLFGTVVAERLVDMLTLLLLLLLAFLTQFGQLIDFLKHNPEISNKILSVLKSPILPAAFFLVVLLLFLFRKKIAQSSLYKKIEGFFKNFGEGFTAIRSIRKKGWFWFHSAFIWLMYYLMFYANFFAFGFTSHLGPLAALAAFVMASFGMVAPVQGGIGAWHFMVIETLLVYGIARENGVIFAFVAHTAMTLMLIVLGLISLLILPFINRRNDVSENGFIQ